jgi:hypothetical protein
MDGVSPIMNSELTLVVELNSAIVRYLEHFKSVLIESTVDSMQSLLLSLSTSLLEKHSLNLQQDSLWKLWIAHQ